MKHLAATAPVSELAIANAFELAANIKKRRNRSRNWSLSISTHGLKSFRATITRKL
jgi:hypothetical protein